ncbi:hypothetical protein CBL_05118 [Carabus blaptoides fortunei]
MNSDSEEEFHENVVNFRDIESSDGDDENEPAVFRPRIPGDEPDILAFTGPQPGIPSNFGPKVLKPIKGDIISRVRDNLSAVFWKDKREVYILTNMYASPAEGNFRDDHGNALKPHCIEDYKIHMGRGLAFRGAIETIGSKQTGNYLGILELLAQFDQFLENHLKLGNVGNHVLRKIITDIKNSKYYLVIVDSTPDVSNTDQLTVVIRYLASDGKIFERFIAFLANTGHKATEMETALSDKLISLELDIKDCRGQSYDNASNMSGIYSGLQQRMKQASNNLAEYVPCAAHSLNLVSSCAAECCLQATSFFMFVQKLYIFFSASTNRRKLLKEECGNSLLPKTLSSTRWSARSDSCKALRNSYANYISALTVIANDASQTKSTQLEAMKLVNKMKKLEIGIMTVRRSAKFR